MLSSGNRTLPNETYPNATYDLGACGSLACAADRSKARVSAACGTAHCVGSPGVEILAGMRRFVPWVCCLVSALSLVAPAGARADGAVTRVGGELRYDSDSQDAENLVITRQTAASECSPGAALCLQFANGPQNIRDQVTGSDCVQVIATVVACSPTGVTAVRLNLNDGDDFVRVGDSVPPTTMDGSFGNDNLSSGNGADTVLGGAGDDQISDDGGVDVLNGGAGHDVVSLRGGNDDGLRGPGLRTPGPHSGGATGPAHQFSHHRAP